MELWELLNSEDVFSVFLLSSSQIPPEKLSDSCQKKELEFILLLLYSFLSLLIFMLFDSYEKKPTIDIQD